MRTPRFFFAGQMEDIQIASRHHDSLLIAVTNIRKKSHIADVARWVKAGKKVIIDSGVFELCQHHAKRNNMTLTAALGLPPEQLDGFPSLMTHYLSIAKSLPPELFALVEVDVGGKEHKRTTRAYLESIGCKVCPVFHPLLDGWEYLDELAEKYPTIFVGNLVDASPALRQKIIGRLISWRERHDVWIHMLGVTPSPMVVSMPMDSCDSSAWLGCVKFFQTWKASALWNKLGGFDRGMAYPRSLAQRTAVPEATHQKSKSVTAADEACQALMAQHFFSCLKVEE